MSIQYIKEKIKLYPFHFSNIFYLIDEFKKFTPEKLKNKDFYFVERVITKDKDNEPAFISYILDSNLNFENLLSDIQSVIQKAEYNQILKNSSDYSDEAKVSKNRIEELIKESREKADLSPEEKEELLIHYLNIAFNFPTISKTVDKIAYEKMIINKKTPPPIILLKINGEKVYNAIDNEQIGVQIINDKQKFFFDEVLKILIAPRNQGQIHIALFPIYDGDITEENKELYGTFLGWFATIIQEEELNSLKSLKLSDLDLAIRNFKSNLRNFKSNFYNSIIKKLLATFVSGKEAIIKKIIENIHLTRIWKKAEINENQSINNTWELKDKKLIINFEKIISDIQPYLPIRLKINPQIYQEDIPKYITLYFPDDFIPPKDKDLENELINFYIKLLTEIYLELLKGREIRNTQIINTFSRIMSRNLPHNISSNVISLTTANLGITEFNIPALKRLLSYLHERTDINALITSDFPPTWSYPAWFLKEIMKNFLEKEYLLKYIAKSENVEIKKDSIKIYINEEECSNLDNDFLLAIPFAYTGFHTFYIILENIIRNSAKHRENKEQGIQIFIKINTDDENFVKFQIHDNITVKQEKVNEINKKIENPIVDNEGKPNLEDMGIAEIKIATAYLNKKSIQETGEADPDFLKATLLNGHLCYEFNIPKPKEILLLSNNKLKNENDFKKHSIYPLYIQKDEELPQNLSFDYEFIAVEEELTGKIEPIKHKLPERIIEIEKRDILKLQDPTNFKKSIYIKWLQKLAEDTGVKLPKEIYLYLYGGETETKIKKVENEAKEIINKILNKDQVSINNELINQIAETLPKKIMKLEEKPETLPDYFQTEQKNENIPEEININKVLTIRNITDITDMNTLQMENDKIYYLRHRKLPHRKNFFYFEPLTGNSTHFYLILSALKSTDDYLKFKLCCQLLENALTKICIWDERTSKTDILNTPYFGDDAIFYEYLKSAGVYVITSKEELDKINEKMYFLILHKGLMDKNIVKIEDLEELGEKFKRIVITSGRGKPQNLPPKTKFIPYSILEKLILSKPHHKFLLTQVLMNLKI
jgi:hypothetical protein